MDKIEFLETEREKMWQRILVLEEAVKKKTSDYEKEAKQASKKTSEFRNKSESSLTQIKDYEDVAQKGCEEITTLLAKIEDIENSLTGKIEYINQQYSTISENEETYSSNVESLEKIFEDFDVLKAKVNNLDVLLTQGDDTIVKINQLLKTASEKRNDINKLYLEIIGSETEGEDGESIIVSGLKDKLENSYNEIEKKVSALQKQLNDTTSTYEATFEQKISGFEHTFQEVSDQIKSLLPDALTTGLSSAYQQKRKDEEVEEKAQTKHFKSAIKWMVVVSIIPFVVAIYQLVVNNVTLYDAMMQLPRMVLAILPLYIPVLWLAYSANKKRNLSKRLIEEYTHKEVLSKTFEGLSTQIANIKDENVSSDLKNKLLYNVLEVTSNNPGTLISDYNKSDHPFMEALDKSAQLASSVEKLSRIPGLDKLASMLDKKSKRIIEKKATEIKEGFDLVSEEEKEEEN